MLSALLLKVYLYSLLRVTSSAIFLFLFALMIEAACWVALLLLPPAAGCLVAEVFAHAQMAPSNCN